ncbi:MAG: hypothetical protein JSV21_09060 [Nitrospirota bacterium]|nr:MAG: hypothetical protein JSV21_09060 [Nitrospirota bacterium]
MRERLTSIAAVVAFIFIFSVTPAPAGGGGGGGGGGAGAGSGHGGSMGGMFQEQEGMKGSGKQEQIQQFRQERIRLNTQQRERLQECTATADRVCERAREMYRFAEGPGFKAGDAKMMQSRLREEVRAMEREHERFKSGLADAQQDQVRDRIRDMDRSRDRIRDQLREMDAELDEPNPSGQRIAMQSREMERQMLEWQKRYREIEQ